MITASTYMNAALVKLDEVLKLIEGDAYNEVEAAAKLGEVSAALKLAADALEGLDEDND